MKSPPNFLLAVLALLCGGAALLFFWPVEAAGGGVFGHPTGGADLLEPARPPAAREAVPPTRPLPRVTVDLRARARILRAPHRPRCALVRGRAGGEVVAARSSWVAGSAALAALDVRARGRQLVRFDLPSGERLYHVVWLPDPDGGEEAAPLTVRLEPGGRYRGRVVDVAGRPIAGARIWLSGREATSGPDGIFVVDGLLARSGLPLVLRAPGMASRFEIVDLDRGTEDRVRAHTLESGAALVVQLAGRVPMRERARLYLVPASTQADTAARHYPFFLAGCGAGDPPGPDGVWRIEGLPAGVALRVIVRHPLAPAAEVVVPRLEPGGRRTATAVVKPRSRVLEGGVTDPRGRRPAGALVLSGPQTASPRVRDDVLLPAGAALPAAACAAFPDSKGRFVLGCRAEDVVTVRVPGGLGQQQRVRFGSLRRLRRVYVVPEASVAGGRDGLEIRVTRPARLRIRLDGDTVVPWVRFGAERPYWLPLREPAVLGVSVSVAPGAEAGAGRELLVVGRTILDVDS